jgi:hypothetical protein
VSPLALNAWRVAHSSTEDPQAPSTTTTAPTTTASDVDVRSEWSVPDRVLADRRSAKDASVVEFLVKWRQLGYDACTWEVVDDTLAPLVESFQRHPSPTIRSVYVLSSASANGAALPLQTVPAYLRQPAAQADTEESLPMCDLGSINWLLQNCQRRQSCMLGDAERAWGTVQVASFVHAAFMVRRITSHSMTLCC